MRLNRANLVYSTSSLCLSLLLAMPAAAQNAAPESAAPKADADTHADIVVTGSLIRRPNNTSVSPISTIGAEAIKDSGQPNLEDALNQMPSFTVSGNAATGGQGTGGGQGAAAGRAREGEGGKGQMGAAWHQCRLLPLTLPLMLL